VNLSRYNGHTVTNSTEVFMALIKSDCKGVERFEGEANDCTVRALANVLGAPYPLAHRLLSAAGRKPKRGMLWSQWSKVYSRLGIKMVSVHGSTKSARFIARASGVKLSQGITIEKMLPLISKGRYIVQVTGHVFAVIDGKILDYGYNPAGARVASVYKLDSQAVIFD
jgi:hypothetical protein